LPINFFSDKGFLTTQRKKTPAQDYSQKQGTLSSSRVAILTDEALHRPVKYLPELFRIGTGELLSAENIGKPCPEWILLTDGSMIRLTIARYYTPTDG
jgi:hypothetical protein